jgi:hypothetical protein
MKKSVSLDSKPKLRGDLTIVITNVITGRQTRHHVRNTITYDGLNSALYLWAQDAITVTDYRIVKLVPGTNPTPPTRGDVSVIAPVLGADINLTAPDRSISPATGELIITGTLPQVSPANGSTLTEVGLVLGNGQLFARQIHPAFLKQIAFTLTYSWRIAMTA